MGEFDGNEFTPTWSANGHEHVCPCCAGAETGDSRDLCDGCALASLVGAFPHGCARGSES